MKIKLITILLLAILLSNNLSFAKGKKAPDFVLKDADDKTFILSQFKGENVLLFFWATWCPFCVVEMRRILEQCDDFKNKDLKMLAINVGENKYKVKRFFKLEKVCFDILFDKNTSVAFAYDLIGVPAFFIIDKNGFIKYSGSRMPRNLDSYLQK